MFIHYTSFSTLFLPMLHARHGSCEVAHFQLSPLAICLPVEANLRSMRISSRLALQVVLPMMAWSLVLRPPVAARLRHLGLQHLGGVPPNEKLLQKIHPYRVTLSSPSNNAGHSSTLHLHHTKRRRPPCAAHLAVSVLMTRQG